MVSRALSSRGPPVTPPLDQVPGLVPWAVLRPSSGFNRPAQAHPFKLAQGLLVTLAGSYSQILGALASILPGVELSAYGHEACWLRALDLVADLSRGLGQEISKEDDRIRRLNAYRTVISDFRHDAPARLMQRSCACLVLLETVEAEAARVALLCLPVGVQGPSNSLV